MTPSGVLKQLFDRHVWQVDLDTLPRGQASLIYAARLGYAVIRDLADGQLTLRAMSLVYTTLLSLVPLLAVSFALLKGFGVHSELEPLLLNFFAPLGEKGHEIASRILGFVENVNAGVLGTASLALLLFTVISLLQKIEAAFNFTWRVKSLRPMAQRFSDYLSVLLVGPFLVFTALGITASVFASHFFQALITTSVFGPAIKLGLRLLPYLLIIGAFTFVYVFVPNTRVKVRSALVGALISGALWETTGWVFASFLVNSAKYAAIYSAFATLILFMIWLYLCWIILLVGASIAFYHQHPEHLATPRRELRLSARMKERLALLFMYHVGRHYYEGRPPWTLEALTKKLRVPMEIIDGIAQSLMEAGLLVTTSERPHAFLPCRPLDAVGLGEVLEAIRAQDEGPYLRPERLPREAPVDSLVGELQHAQKKALEGRTVKDLATQMDAAHITRGDPALRGTGS